MLRSGQTRRTLLAGAGAAALAPVLPPIRLSFAQTIESGKPLPPLLMESYPDQMTVEAGRLYARELEKIGIVLEQKPVAFGQILGKVYGRKELVTAMLGFGSPEERIDPDFYIRAIYSTGGSFNAPGYSNPAYDAVANAQARETDPAKRKALIAKAQQIYGEDVPSWHVCSRAAINPVNTRLFKNFKPSRALGLELYHVAPYLVLEPATPQVREVNVATTFRLSSAHPFTERSANGRGFLRFVFDTFLRYDSELKIIPWAAEAYTQTGPTTYEIKLRQGMKWHDGKPVTIDDAKFTFDYLLQWKPPFWASFLVGIKAATAVDAQTLRVELEAPSATFITTSLVQIALLPKHVWENVQNPTEWDAIGKGGMIGSGPFRFVSFQKDVDCYVRANKEHFTGGPKIDGLHYIQSAGIEQLIGGMETEQIHIVGDGLTLPDAERLARSNKAIQVITTHTGTVVSFWLDMRKPPFSDKALRQAMYFATPKKQIIDIALGGAGQVARRSPIPPVYGEWIPDEIPGDEYDIAKARKVLESAGYRWEGNRLIAK